MYPSLIVVGFFACVCSIITSWLLNPCALVLQDLGFNTVAFECSFHMVCASYPEAIVQQLPFYASEFAIISGNLF